MGIPMSSDAASHWMNTVTIPARSAVASHAAVAGRKYVVELIGTFFLVFTVGACVLVRGPLAPLAIGSALMVMIYAGGHISGGHYNPAVTLAALVRGRIDLGGAIGYWISQLVAGVLAALVVRAVVPHARITTMTLSGRLGAAFVAELLFTFALCYVVLNVATSRDIRTTPSTAWRSASPCSLPPSPSAVFPVPRSTRRSLSVLTSWACTPGRRSGSTWSPR